MSDIVVCRVVYALLMLAMLACVAVVAMARDWYSLPLALVVTGAILYCWRGVERDARENREFWSSI